MDVVKAIFNRRSVRDYTDQPVETDVIANLIVAATQAPNAVNQQPWTFTVVRDQVLLGHISQHAKTHMLATIAADPHAVHFVSHLSDPDFHIFYHAPALVLISAVAQGPWIVEDCALAAENLMLAAYAEGLGSCWIGFAQSYFNTAEGKATLALPPLSVAVAPIILGHPKSAPAPVPRNPPEIRWLG
jgi:nitroreductase